MLTRSDHGVRTDATVRAWYSGGTQAKCACALTCARVAGARVEDTSACNANSGQRDGGGSGDSGGASNQQLCRAVAALLVGGVGALLADAHFAALPAPSMLRVLSLVPEGGAFLEEADTIFSKFDLNDDGQLSWAEVDKFTRRPDAFGGGSDADLFMALVDTNQSETVDRAEWHTFLLGIWNKHGPEAAKGFLAMLQMSFDIPE